MRSTDRQEHDALHEGVAASPEESREIELVVSLLRSLPDPEPETDITARVMQKVREFESRPRLLRVAFGSRLEPRAAAALAAGVACVALAIGLNRMGPSSDAPTGPDGIHPAPIARYPVPGNRVAIEAGLPDPRTAALFAGAPEPTLTAFPVVAAPAPDLLDRRLDAQLNQLQLDPHAFFRRLERVRQRDRFVQRLADRAARRGDAAQVALSVRAVPHPLATPMVDQFLHASLVRQVGGR